jgi:hypothetical protein
MKVMVSRGTYNLMWAPNHGGGLGILQFSEDLFLVEVNVPVCEQKICTQI